MGTPGRERAAVVFPFGWREGEGLISVCSSSSSQSVPGFALVSWKLCLLQS